METDDLIQAKVRGQYTRDRGWWLISLGLFGLEHQTGTNADFLLSVYLQGALKLVSFSFGRQADEHGPKSVPGGETGKSEPKRKVKHILSTSDPAAQTPQY